MGIGILYFLRDVCSGITGFEADDQGAACIPCEGRGLLLKSYTEAVRGLANCLKNYLKTTKLKHRIAMQPLLQLAMPDTCICRETYYF